jgi:hypothetical protein
MSYHLPQMVAAVIPLDVVIISSEHDMQVGTAILTLKKRKLVRCLWFTPVILATKEAEIRRITDRSQLRQIVHETLP